MSIFGKRKVLRNGTEADAVVLGCELGGLQNSHNEYRAKVDLRVHFPDGTTEDVTCHTWTLGSMSTFGAGEIVKVRVDPSDRSKVEIDREAMLAGRDAKRAEARDALVRFADEKLEQRRTDS